MIRTLPATTPPGRVQDVLAEMADGETYVIAMEVFDHPQAVWVANRLPYGGDGGPGVVGAWVLGPETEVYTHLRLAGWDDALEQYGVGGPSDAALVDNDSIDSWVAVFDTPKEAR
jgi:hypothetical protein